MSEVTKSEAAVKIDSITIQSDGTLANTTLVVNGQTVTDLRKLSVWIEDEQGYKALRVSYTIGDHDDHDSENGTGVALERKSYQLYSRSSKATKDVPAAYKIGI